MLFNNHILAFGYVMEDKNDKSTMIIVYNSLTKPGSNYQSYSG